MDTSKNNLTLPLVSVIIPAYNAEAFIAKTLLSVRSQTYHHIEILVVDDGSRDRTAEIVKSFAQEDPRIILLQQSNSGVAAARNLAIAKSQGEYIAPIDADDIWYPQNLEKKVQCLLASEPNVGLIYSWSIDINAADLFTGGFYNSIIEGEVYQALIYKYFLGNASTALIRRSCFDRVGGYNTQLKAQQAQGCEDWDLYLRIAEHYQFKVIPEFLVGYRQLATSMSCDYTEMAKSQSLVIANIQQKHPEISPNIYNWSLSSFHLYLAIKSSHNRNYQSSLFWLNKAFQEDWTMTLLHHNFYLLMIKNLLEFIKQLTNPQGEPKPQPEIALNSTSNSNNSDSNNSGMTIADIEQRMNIHKLLPSQVYEQIRLKRLSN
ncbi:glycosyl transferase family 2 [Oscillatoriales cyanobacterium USR001]|nr:glycosyl transferase family 2 [Oscillatoriales cyanobacterium USR001]